MASAARHGVAVHGFVPFVVGVLAAGLIVTRGAHVATLLAGGTVLACAAVAAPAGRLRIALAAVLAGMAAMALATGLRGRALAPDHLVQRVAREPVAVVGSVAERAQVGTSLRLVLHAQHYRSAHGAGAASGRLQVTVAWPRGAWPEGARVRVVGRLRAPRNFCNPGGYDYAGALARRGIFVTMFLWDDAAIELLAPPRPGLVTALGAVRARVRARLEMVATPAAQGVLAAVLLGERGAVDDATRRMLARAGVGHVLAVSGFHVAVVAGVGFAGARAGLARVPWILVRFDATKLAALASVLPVLLYAAIAGGSVSAARAVLMYGLLLVALACDRPADALRALAAAALVLAAATPDIAADISFELSFAAVAALILAARWTERAEWTPGAARRWSHPRLPVRPADATVPRRPGRVAGLLRGVLLRLVIRPLAVTLAACAATAPLTAWHFQQVSLIAPLANLVALPLLGPATLVPGLAALPCVLVAPPLADALLRVAAMAADLGLRVAAGFAAIPWAAVATPMPSSLELALVYGALGLPLVPGQVAWPGRMDRRVPPPARDDASDGPPRPPLRLRRTLAAVLLLAAATDVAYWVWERGLNPRLRVTYLSVGHGDAAVLELPRGGVVVLDGGGFPGDFDTGARLLAPFLRARKVRRLDALVLSHPHLDHYGGLAYLAEHFAPREFWSNGVRAPGARFARLEVALDRAGTRRRVLRRGDTLAVGAVQVEVLNPGPWAGADPNNGALVLRMRYGASTLLFTGDVERRAEAELVAGAAPLASLVLKVPHHGSATSTSPALVAAVAPRVAIISVGADGRFELPAAAVVARLVAAGAEVWRTDRDGAVRVESDGTRLAVGASCSPRRWRES